MDGVTDRDEIQRLIGTKSWYHRYEIVPGVVTPGICPCDAGAMLDAAGVSRDLRGKRAVDIGTWDGPVAFELERRGAEVIGLDIQDPDNTGFNVARKILGSKVKYIRATVYDLPDVIEEELDLIVFRGVFYHLKNPIVAFEKISEVLAPEGMLQFEGECALHYAEDLNGKRVRVDFSTFNENDVPITLCYPAHYKNVSNWFIPNLACLKSWMATCGLEVVSHYYESDAPTESPEPTERVVGLAKKVKKLLGRREPQAIPAPHLASNQRVIGLARKVRRESATEEHPVYGSHWR